MSTTTPDGEPKHHRARHRRRPTARQRITRALPVVLVVAAVVAVVIALEHHHPGRRAAVVHVVNTTSTTFPTASTIPVASTSSTSSTTTTSTTTTSTTTTIATPTTLPAAEVTVEIENGSGVAHVASTAATDLHAVGFPINGTQDAPSFTYSTSVIEYAPGELADADTVLAHVNGPTRLVEVSSIPAGEVYLILGSTFTGVAQ